MSPLPPAFLFGLHLIIALIAATGTAASLPAHPTFPAAACRASVYPKLCRAVLSPIVGLPTGSYAFGQLSVKQALKQARRTSAMLDRLLSPGGTARSRRLDGGAAARALADCRELSYLSAGYLETVEAKMAAGERALSAAEADHVRALMSALLTNQQTCFDGLQGAAARGSAPAPPSTGTELFAPLANATRVYSVSLELVTSALGGKSRERGVHTTGRRLTGGDRQRVMLKGVRINSSVVVAKDGSGNFTTVGDAVAAAPNGTDAVEDGYFKIVVGEGVYEENILVGKEKKNLILVGAGINRTVITGNRNVVDGNWTTFTTATFAVHGERFVAVGITFENTAGPEKHQAVAVRNSADLSAFYRCSFLGYQDTLYVHSLRQFYRDCDVYGTVDFIFGNAASVFQNCRIYARKPLTNQANAVTAQGRTHPNQTTGISIHNCTVGGAPELGAEAADSTRTYLGRPWKEFSRTVYMQSYIDGVIQPEGWLEWNGTFALSSLYYGEFGNYGPGASTNNRVQWPGYSLMSATDALRVTVFNFTMGDIWLPYTSIPYAGGCSDYLMPALRLLMSLRLLPLPRL